jgi:hypothetical protein
MGNICEVCVREQRIPRLNIGLIRSHWERPFMPIIIQIKVGKVVLARVAM